MNILKSINDTHEISITNTVIIMATNNKITRFGVEAGPSCLLAVSFGDGRGLGLRAEGAERVQVG